MEYIATILGNFYFIHPWDSFEIFKLVLCLLDKHQVLLRALLQFADIIERELVRGQQK